jgi:hypothetical protein
MLTNLCEDYKPEATHEEMLVEPIAVGYCKVSLVHGCESEFLGSGLGLLTSGADRLGRYSTSINRQLIQSMNQLERLQRQRRGEIRTFAGGVGHN